MIVGEGRVPWTHISRLQEEDDLESFSCGLAEVDNWLHGKARGAQRMVHVVTWLCRDDEDRILACYSLKSIPVAPEPWRSNKKITKFLPRKGWGTAILLCQFGLSTHVPRHQGLGTILFDQVLLTVDEAARIAPADLFVVDPANESLVSFYQKASGGALFVSDNIRLGMTMLAVRKFASSFQASISPDF